MKIEEYKYCKKCDKKTIHIGTKHKFNWIFHFVMIFLTGFLWLIPFLFYYMAKKDTGDNLVCTNCSSH